MQRLATPTGSPRSPVRAAGRAGLGCLLVLAAGAAHGEQGGVRSTLHNLSVSGPGEIRSIDETEVCKFCHIPHGANRAGPLWSRKLSEARYEMPPVRDRSGEPTAAGQPDGSSRLCLSCHDGTVALGKILGRPKLVAMAGAQRLAPGRRGFLGTDLSGSHPISFVVPDGDGAAERTAGDIGLRRLDAIRAETDVRLDTQGKMQCTTCHDPHDDRYYRRGLVPRFWVRPTVEEVCLACHEPR